MLLFIPVKHPMPLYPLSLKQHLYLNLPTPSSIFILDSSATVFLASKGTVKGKPNLTSIMIVIALLLMLVVMLLNDFQNNKEPHHLIFNFIFGLKIDACM